MPKAARYIRTFVCMHALMHTNEAYTASAGDADGPAKPRVGSVLGCTDWRAEPWFKTESTLLLL